MERIKKIDQVLTGEFRLFDYHISHSILLLRFSHFIEDKNWNVDLKFEGVNYMEMPTQFGNTIHITNATPQERAYIDNRHNGADFNHTSNDLMEIFKITSNNKNYFIVAFCLSISTNDLSNHISPFPKI